MRHGSASRKKRAYMLSLGADVAVDYAAPDWKQQVRQACADGVSAALTIHPGTAADGMDVVRDAGKVITVSGDQIGAGRGIVVAELDLREDVRQVLATLAADVVEG